MKSTWILVSVLFCALLAPRYTVASTYIDVEDRELYDILEQLEAEA